MLLMLILVLCLCKVTNCLILAMFEFNYEVFELGTRISLADKDVDEKSCMSPATPMVEQIQSRVIYVLILFHGISKLVC